MNKETTSALTYIFHFIAIVILSGCLQFQLDYLDSKMPANGDGQSIIGVGMFIIYSWMALLIGCISVLISFYQILNHKGTFIKYGILIVVFVLTCLVIYFYGK